MQEALIYYHFKRQGHQTLLISKYTHIKLEGTKQRLERDGNDRRSIGCQITSVFTYFSQKQNRYDIVRNKYGADILIISKR